jgi:hypothetical protein
MRHPSVPPITPALSRRIQRAIASLHIAGMTAVRDLQGNPFGVRVERFGVATALLAADVGDDAGWWNRVVELDEKADDATLDALLALYRAAGLRCFVDLTPATLTERLVDRLASRGVLPAECGAVSYGSPVVAEPAPAEGVTMHELGREDADQCTTLWAAGFEVSSGPAGEAARIRSGWFRVPGNRLYVAEIEGEPVAMAALYVHDAIGFLNVGATLPPYRGRGLHSLLTARRIGDAARAGCELVIGETGYGTISHVHLQRAGMCLAYNALTFRDRGP